MTVEVADSFGGYEVELVGNFKFKKTKGVYKGKASEFTLREIGGSSYNVLIDQYSNKKLNLKQLGNKYADLSARLVSNDDIIIGSKKALNIISGGRGDDTLVAGEGGAEYSDILIGGQGADRFDLTVIGQERTGSFAMIEDFEAGPDGDVLDLPGDGWDEYHWVVDSDIATGLELWQSKDGDKYYNLVADISGITPSNIYEVYATFNG